MEHLLTIAVRHRIEDLTRREFMFSALGAALLVACGDDDDDDDDGSGAGSTPAPATRTVDSASGKITVPADPQRVICIDYFTAIFLIELGLTPVGGIDYSWIDSTSMFPEYVEPLKALTNIGEITSTNFEQVTALHPDLILGPTPGSRYDNSRGAMDTLVSVAPVAAVDFGQSGDWRGPFAQTAEIINRSDRLTPIRAAYEQAISAAKSAHADQLANTTVSVIDYAQDGQYAIDLPKSGNGVVLGDLGVRFGQAAIDDGTNSREL
jgi:iron complex transport system substrate-binding protein